MSDPREGVDGAMTGAGDTAADLRAANSYDFVRFVAASCVLFSHHFDLAGFDEPKVPFYGEDFGYLGVEIFFCLSGFLICRSLQRRRDFIRFAAARVCRIFPNLLFALAMTSLVTLLWYRNGAHLAAHIAYVTDNLAMFVRGVRQTIPGVFEDAVRHNLNDPLWTLPYELWLYVLLALIFAIGRRRAGLLVVAVALAVSIAWTFEDDIEFDLGPFESDEFFRLGSYFLSGAVLAVAWPYLKSRAIVLGVAGVALALAHRNLMPADTIVFSLAVAMAVVGLGSARVMARFSRGGDASYGMYVFAWPIQQFSLMLIGSFWLSMLAAFLFAAALGYATWHLFEKRVLRYPDRIAARVRRPAPAQP